MIEVPVYIPNPDAGETTPTAIWAKASLAPHSAIVGLPTNAGPDDHIIVYYEGNIYGAANMVTFADRAMFAYWRMRDQYPTVAMIGVKRRELLRVAKLYPEHGRIEPLDGRGLYQLHEWLEIPIGEGSAWRGQRMMSELSCQEVRV